MKHTRIENRHHIAHWIHVTPERITNLSDNFTTT